MKKILLITAILFGMVAAHSAQENHLIVFSEDLLNFDAYLNGIKQNEKPTANVKVTGLEGQTYKLKIRFEDESIPEINKSLYFEQMGLANTLKITHTKKGYKARFFGSVPIAESPVEYSAYEYTNTERESYEPVIEQDVEIKMNTNIDIQEEVQSNTQTSKESVQMDVNFGGVNMGVNVQVEESHTTNSTYEESIDTEYEETIASDMFYGEAVEMINCELSDLEVEDLYKQMQNASFSDSKMTIAKQATRANCLTSFQIKTLMRAFDFEDDRLDYAKFAYEFCTDQNKYYLVNNAFEFESSIEELNEHISK